MSYKSAAGGTPLPVGGGGVPRLKIKIVEFHQTHSNLLAKNNLITSTWKKASCWTKIIVVW